jgi:hypothetical protein
MKGKKKGEAMFARPGKAETLKTEKLKSDVQQPYCPAVRLSCESIGITGERGAK